MESLFLLIRTIAYASVFIAVLLVALPRRILAASGIARPSFGWVGTIGAIVAAAGALLALWCIFTFLFVGKGTPAPFDPPRRLVVAGPYRYVRNPMYLGGALALIGAAVVYRSVALLGYGALFLAATHLFVVGYEEPALTRTFGEDYRAYRSSTRRWWPRLRSPHPG